MTEMTDNRPWLVKLFEHRAVVARFEERGEADTYARRINRDAVHGKTKWRCFVTGDEKDNRELTGTIKAKIDFECRFLTETGT